MPGPKRRPAALDRLMGNPGHRRVVDEDALIDDAGAIEIDAEASAPATPEWIDTAKHADTPAARELSDLAGRLWAELYPELTRMKLVRRTDELALARWCRYGAEWVLLTRVIDREGFSYVTSSPHIAEMRRPHPATRARAEAERALQSIGDSLGLTPAARQRIFAQLAASGGAGRSGDLFPVAPSREDAPGAPERGSGAAAGPIGILGRPN